MKQTLYDGSRTTTINTRYDDCLYRAPRPRSSDQNGMITGKDLYLHTGTGPDKKNVYYLYLWSSSNEKKGRILPIMPSVADRFLKNRGLVCDLFPKNDPVDNLYAWGYGIAEEF